MLVEDTMAIHIQIGASSLIVVEVDIYINEKKEQSKKTAFWYTIPSP